jgi:hypothetical protein
MAILTAVHNFFGLFLVRVVFEADLEVVDSAHHVVEPEEFSLYLDLLLDCKDFVLDISILIKKCNAAPNTS